jgi:hypothetical protein
MPDDLRNINTGAAWLMLGAASSAAPVLFGRQCRRPTRPRGPVEV